MKKLLNWRIALALIFLLGAFLRFYKLGVIPDGFHVDEAYLSYNAFSILKTGKEMTGNLLPLNLKSFLFSPAGYSYFSIPFIYLFGLSEFSARFASAFFGTVTIPLVFLFVKKLFKKNPYSIQFALATSFFIAISPWNINLSRVSTDNVLVVFFVTLGVYLYIYWLEKNKIYLCFLSAISFFITLFIYQAARSFLPIFLPLLFAYGFYEKKAKKKKLIISGAFYLLLIIIPVILILYSPNLSYRIRTLSIFQNPSTQLSLDEQIREEGVLNSNPIVARVFHNKLINYSQTFVQNYLDHFSYKFLFTDSGLPIRYKVSEMGLLYIFDLPLILLGIWSIFKINKKTGWFILGWVLIAPIGSALTFDDIPNLQRTLVIFPALSILSGLGLVFVAQLLKNKIKKGYVLNLSYFILGLIILYNFAFYISAYYVNNIVHRPWYRQEGYRQLIKTINLNSNKYNIVTITDWNSAPTIFLLFYNKYNPSLIQKTIEKTQGTNYGSMSFKNYLIAQEECPLRKAKTVDKITGETKEISFGEKGVLYVDGGNCKSFPDGTDLIANIKRPDGTIVFKVVALK